LFLLDEPASNLHSSAQAELLESFEKPLDRCSLIYTTHSHHLINVRWLDTAYVGKNAAVDSLNFANYMTTRMGARTGAGSLDTVIRLHIGWGKSFLILLDRRYRGLETAQALRKRIWQLGSSR
jgi:ABC-type dipeptide/oligopeptide/nickel transport system ATPase subunit